MEEDFKINHIKDIGFMDKTKLSYVKLKGFIHIWTYFKTKEGNFLASLYTKEKGVRIASIRNTPEGWLVHMFIGTSKFKSYFKTVPLLKDAEEYCNLFLDNKLVLDNK